jgi:glutamate synthase domain-containing protein 3
MSTTVSQFEIDAAGVHYSELNRRIRDAVECGATEITLRNVFGQRYIGTNLHGAASPDNLRHLRIHIYGTPGNDLGAFLGGPTIIVHGNAMDGTGNTMSEGRIVIHGRAGDITGLSARGGEIFVRDGVGYRTGVHMKEYSDLRPVIVVGTSSQDFLGEYMAGGVIILLGLNTAPGKKHTCRHVCNGMHGGVVFVRGELPESQIGRGVGKVKPSDEDKSLLSNYIEQYGNLFDIDVSCVEPSQFIKLVPLTTRPYKRLYAY